MRWIVVGLVGAMLVGGCSAKKSSLLMERRSRGPMEDTPLVGGRIAWQLEPAEQTLALDGVEVTARFASHEFLTKLYGNKKIFGEYAGPNPFFPEQLVYYVKIANRSDKRVKINPLEFVVIDDRGNQYSSTDADYVNALAEARAPVSTATRGMLEDARPGYFGFSLPVGKLVSTKNIARFAQIKQSSMQTGYMHPGVTHDGVIAYWSPVKDVKTVTLLVTNIKTDFDANDFPQKALHFPFTFKVISAPAENPKR